MYNIDVVRKAVYEGIKRVKKIEDEITIGDDETFADYGLDSLDRMSLFLEIETPLGIQVDSINFENLNTIRLICDFVNEKHD